MKLVFTIPDGRGGVARSGTRIANALRQLGHDVFLLTGYELLPMLEHGRIDWPDLIQAFYAGDLSEAVIATANKLDIPSVLAIRGGDLGAFHTRRPDIKAIQECTTFTALSEDLLAEARAIRGEGTLGRVILNSIDQGEYLPGTASVELANSPFPVLGIAANLVTRLKGIGTLIEAMSGEGAGHWLEAAHLLIIGRPAANIQYQLDTTPEMAGRYTVTGWLRPEQILQHMRLCDVGIVPSLEDACPNTLYEWVAAFQGTDKPIVASRVGSIPALLGNYAQSMCFTLGDPYDFQLMLDVALDSPHPWHSFYERFLAEYTPEREAQQYLEVYREVLGDAVRA